MLCMRADRQKSKVLLLQHFEQLQIVFCLPITCCFTHFLVSFFVSCSLCFDNVTKSILAPFWCPCCALAGSFCLTCWGPFFDRFLEPFINDFRAYSGPQNRCKIWPVRNLDHLLFNDSSTLLEKRGCSIRNCGKIHVFFYTMSIGSSGSLWGSLWAPFGLPLAPFWLPLLTFGSPLAPLWPLLASLSNCFR